MKKREETKHLDKEWKTMNSHLEVFLDTGNQEDLHKFRVQIKRLKAMLNLFEGSSEQQGLMKLFKPIKKIFKSAGLIREAHINLQLSEQYELKNEHFQLSQHEIIEKGTDQFKLQSKKIYKNIKATYKALKKQLPPVHNSSIAKYYKNQLQQIAVNFTVSGFNEDMHTNRKLIKILVYNHKIADKALDGKLTFNSDYLDKLQEAIGNWHDNIVAEQLFSSPELNDKTIVSKIKKINTRVKRSISRLADDFLNKATTDNKTVSTT